MSATVAVDKCSDPYGVGCRQEAVGCMRGYQFSGEFNDFKTTAIEIYTCSRCCWWNCDWDWEKEPEGPNLPRDKRHRG